MHKKYKKYIKSTKNIHKKYKNTLKVQQIQKRVRYETQRWKKAALPSPFSLWKAKQLKKKNQQDISEIESEGIRKSKKYIWQLFNGLENLYHSLPVPALHEVLYIQR